MVLPRTLVYSLYHKLDFYSQKTTKARIFHEELPTAYTLLRAPLCPCGFVVKVKGLDC